MNEIVETGIIKNTKDSTNYPYTMKILNNNNTEEILNLQHEILSNLENPQICVYLTVDEINEMLSGFGQMVGVYVNNTMVALGGSLFPGQRKDNLGRDIGIKGEELMKVAHLEFAAVHYNYRGNSLQKKIASFLVKEIIKSGKFDYLMNTISPYNPISLDTDFYLGFLITKLSRKYDGALRYILIKYIKKSINIDKNTIISLQTSNLDKQSELFEQGYYGLRFEAGSKYKNILFGKGGA